MIRRKRKKLRKFCTNETSKQLVDERFWEHSNLFTFFTDLNNFCDEFSPGILNLVNLLTLAPSSLDISNTSSISTNSDILSNESPNLLSSNKIIKSSSELFSEGERDRDRDRERQRQRDRDRGRQRETERDRLIDTWKKSWACDDQLVLPTTIWEVKLPTTTTTRLPLT